MNSATYSSGLLDVSLAKIQELNQDRECYFTSNFSDGFSDGEHNFKPIVDQWFNSDYRQGYLLGLSKRMGIEYALIYDREQEQILII